MKLLHTFPLLITCVFIFSLYMISFRGKNIMLTSRTPSTTLSNIRTSTSAVNPSKMRGEGNSTLPNIESLAEFKTISNSCNHLTFPDKLMQSDRWQRVDTDNTNYVFSAYQEDDEVKVIGISSRITGSVKFSCQLWSLSSDTASIHVITVPSDRKILNANHGKSYAASFFTCHLPKENTRGRVMAVSISNSDCTQPLNVVPVSQNYGNGQFGVINNFTVCVASFHHNYDKAYRLVEWIELNRILGADKFIFYNFSCASNVGKVLQSYSKLGLVEVVDWKLPIKVNSRATEEIHYFGQMASLNDCLFRSRGRSEFVVNVDLDEFIIPRDENVTTWREILEGMSNKTAVYMFANTFFEKNWNDSVLNFSGHEKAIKYRLVTLLWLHRKKKRWNYHQRSKYIGRTDRVQELRIHTVNRQTGDTQNVPQELAQLQHYRDINKIDGNEEIVEDYTIVKKYKDKLLSNVREKWKALRGVFYDIPT